MFKTKYLKLTKEQKQRGVIYSSIIYCDNDGCEPVLYEVMRDDKDRWDKIERLKDVSFFKAMANDFGWNAIEERRK